MLFQSFAKSPSPAQLLPTVLTPSPNIYPPLNFFKKIEKFIYRGILPESFALGNEKNPTARELSRDRNEIFENNLRFRAPDSRDVT